MDFLLLSLLLVTGFVGCAEFGSVVLVHPAVRRLPVDAQLAMEQGLLRTFEFVMPFGMTGAAVLAGVSAQHYGGGWFTAAAALSIALVVTIIGNAPTNLWTFRLPAGQVPENFVRRRRAWDVYQAVRGSLQLLGFVLVALGVAADIQ